MTGLLLIGLAAMWVAASRWIVRAGFKFVPDQPWRKGAQAGALLLLLLLPLADEIVGSMQFHRLCEKSDRVFVDRERIRDAIIYYIPASSENVTGLAISVTRQPWRHAFSDTGQLVLAYESYHADGGWLVRTLGITENHAPLLFRSSCAPTQEVLSITRQFNVKIADLPATNGMEKQ